MTEEWVISNLVPVIEDPPYVELLRWLVRGSLKQHLLRAVRLWVWLHSLYGDEPERLCLDDPFTYRQWRDAFFSPTHPIGEANPELHDPKCACAKTAADWLFHSRMGLEEPEWRRSLQQQVAISDEVLDDLLQSRLFGVTRRSLAGDLQALTELGWLTCAENQYYRVQEFPARPGIRDLEPVVNRFEVYDLGFLNPNLEMIAQNFCQPIGEVQRFYLEVDYITVRTQARVEKWIEKLKSLWERSTVPPVCLTYHSVKYGVAQCIIYPVCIYYVQRAVYLCGFGQPPSGQGDWYNYRLDKIQAMKVLTWEEPSLPKRLRQRQKTLPTPQFIRDRMLEAWGFDFYLPAKPMLLRFEREFHDRYIQGTSRHDTFKPVTYAWVRRLIQEEAASAQQKALLKLLDSRSKDDAFYKVVYRDGDTNVALRLRSWRPNVEILLPWSLRQQVAQDVEKEFKLYHKQ